MTIPTSVYSKIKKPTQQNYLIRGNYIFLAAVVLAIYLGSITGTLAQEAPPPNIKIENRSLQLFSSGIRSFVFLDIYECAVYLDGKEKNIDAVLDLTLPVAIRLKILTSELPDQVPDPWKETIKPEVSDKIYSRFKKQYVKLAEGDIILFNYFPGESTVFYLNGKKMFVDPGSSLMQALLEQWLGPTPVSEDLKASLIKG